MRTEQKLGLFFSLGNPSFHRHPHPRPHSHPTHVIQSYAELHYPPFFSFALLLFVAAPNKARNEFWATFFVVLGGGGGGATLFSSWGHIIQYWGLDNASDNDFFLYSCQRIRFQSDPTICIDHSLEVSMCSDNKIIHLSRANPIMHN